MPDNTLSGPPAPDSVEKLSFEAALSELDEVVRTLESGNIPLEASLKLLTRGMEIATHCDQTLSQAESVLEQLTLTEEGELASERLQWLDEDDEDGAEDDEEA